MPPTTQPASHPRKTPVQARSTATVDAILEATIQVLLTLGKERLTTTAVAHRAGVSVGTLYQYFPNKRALLQASLKRHMNEIGQSILHAGEQHRSKSLIDMADALIHAYLAAKMRDVKTSAALYAVASDIDGHAIAQATSNRSLRVIANLFATAKEPLAKDPELIASVVVSAINGISRRILESKSPERAIGPLREELTVLVHAYLRTCTTPHL